jgi:hypothetical protein
MRGSIRAQQTRLRQAAGVPSIGLLPPATGRVHWAEVRIGYDHLMAEPLEAARNPFALRPSFDQDARVRPLAQHLGEARHLGPDPSLDQLPVLGENTDLAFPLVHVDANILHG